MGSNTCVACETGFYSDAGASSCLVCPAGYQCPNGIRSACNGGGYSDAEKQTSCKLCFHVGPDRYTPSDGGAHTACNTCALGMFVGSSSNLYLNTCDLCPAGMACDGTADKVHCHSGKFASGTGNYQCTRCAPMTYSRGYQVGDPGQIPAIQACTLCTAGSYTNKDQTACLGCIEGGACPQTPEFPFPIHCAGGFYSAANAHECVPCPDGSFSPQYGNPPTYGTTGMYAMKMAAIYGNPFTYTAATPDECLPCTDPGYYILNGSSCELCPLDHRCPGGGEKIECDPDEYQQNFGKRVCETCPSTAPHYYYAYIPTRSRACNPLCPAGSYCVGGNIIGMCAAGTYSSPGSLACTPCPSNTYSANPGSSSCTQCTPPASSGENSTECVQCAPGSFFASDDARF
jgi:hypothetical protein